MKATKLIIHISIFIVGSCTQDEPYTIPVTPNLHRVSEVEGFGRALHVLECILQHLQHRQDGLSGNREGIEALVYGTSCVSSILPTRGWVLGVCILISYMVPEAV